MMINNLDKINRSLWIITGMASIPFAILAFIEPDKVSVPEIYYIIVFASFFNGIIVPFVLLKERPNWAKKIIAIGINLLIATLWIYFTGGTKSIFYPAFYFLPIIASTMYCGFIYSIVTAFLSSGLSIMFQYTQGGFNVNLADTSILVDLTLFFVVAAILGYLIQVEKDQQVKNQKITAELEAAYRQLSASHEQLQSYTEIIEKMNKEMEQLAITDELTALYNYRYFQVTLEKELKRNRYSCVSLIMIDIDYFKQYNDNYGHMMGNKLLTEIARIIQDHVRGIDTVVRYGGEEFVIILPATDTDEAYLVAERIRKVVETTSVKTPSGLNTYVTISAGIATFPQDAKNQSELISHADLALYEAKSGGRNKVCVYEGE